MKIIFSTILILLASAQLRADVIFSSLTSPTSGGFEVCGGTGAGCAGNTFSPAASFTSPGDYYLTEVQVGVYSLNEDPTFDVFLYSNSAGLPGSKLAEIASDVTAPPLGSGPTVLDLTTPIDLTTGVKYWLGLTAFDSGSGVVWEGAGSSEATFTADDVNGSYEFNDGEPVQFELDGTPTPEPQSAGLVVASVGLALVALRRNRFRKAR